MSNASDVNLHDLVKWTITVSNKGPDAATGVVVKESLPKSLIWISDDAAGKYNHDSGVWNVGNLNKSSSAKLNIVCRVNATGPIKNSVSVTGNEFDIDKSNNNDTKTVKVAKASDLGIVKVVNPSTVNYTDVVCWTLTVTNYGPDAATGVKIYETLPNGFVYLNSTKPLVNGVIVWLLAVVLMLKSIPELMLQALLSMLQASKEMSMTKTLQTTKAVHQ